MGIKKSVSDNDFSDMIKIIGQSRENALRRVNEELILMYWQPGEYLSEKSMSSCKSDEERLFYMQLCIKERYSVREPAR